MQLQFDEAAMGVKETGFAMDFLDDEKVAAFRTESEAQRASTLCRVRDWLLKLEESGQDIKGVDFACHDVTPLVQKDAAGDVLGRAYTIKVKEPCVFVPTPTPRKVNSANPPSWEDAGSLIVLDNLANWNAQSNGCHSAGFLQILPRWLSRSNEQMQAITPEKPGIYVTGPLLFKAGSLVQLA